MNDLCVCAQGRAEVKTWIRAIEKISKSTALQGGGQGERSEFLLEQDQNSFIELLYGEVARGRGKNGVITGNGAKNPFGFAK